MSTALTSGAEWAIARLEELYAHADYRSHMVGSRALTAQLRAGDPIALAMCRPPAAQHPERMAILQAALVRDALVDLIPDPTRCPWIGGLQ